MIRSGGPHASPGLVIKSLHANSTRVRSGAIRKSSLRYPPGLFHGGPRSEYIPQEDKSGLQDFIPVDARA